MKTGIFFIISSIALAGEIMAQDFSPLPPARRTHFEVIAGPTFFRTENKQIFPSLKYHIGINAIRQLRRSSLRLGIQYLPLAATFRDREYYFKFSNHLVAASLTSKLPVTRNKRLTIDLGLTYGVTVAHFDNYKPPVYTPDIPPPCYESGALPVRNKTHLVAQAGTSYQVSRKFSVGVTYGLGADPAIHVDEYSTPAYYLLQASLAYRI